MNTRARLTGWSYVAVTAAMVLFASVGCAGTGPAPVGQWVFTPEHVKETTVAGLAGGPAARIARKVPVADAGDTKALQLDGGANAIQVPSKEFAEKFLKKKFTAEAWVRVDQFHRWSRFAGVFARQHNKRLGWFIGTHYHRFVFALGTKTRTIDLHSGGSAHPGHWYHVAGTYDGKRMQLYVNGLVVAESTDVAGDVVLPANTPFSMADYHNGAEFYPLRGALHEVRVYNQVLTKKQIQKHYAAKARLLEAAPPLVMSGCFGDNMVLQSEAPLPVWGQTMPGDRVTVTCAGKSASAKADHAGRWRINLPKLDAGGPHTFAVATPRGRIVHRNVLVGDVWFCAGQSNLALGTRRTVGNRGHHGQHYPNIRLFTVVRESEPEPTEFTGGWWDVCNPGTVAEFSGVGFFFGRRVHLEMKTPVGLFNASWGGTPVESWISRDLLKTTATYAPAIKKEPADKWGRSGLYNKMIHPLVPYAIRGAVWYQGESNVGNAHLYEELFGLMIRDWRARWGQGEFPFYYVQIAPFNYGGKFNTACAELWDAQRRTLAVANTGMAVSTDVTSTHDNHASNKLAIGERLALWALAKTYGRKGLVYSGPLYRSMKIKGRRVRIHFDHTGGGLKSRNGKPLDWFTVAGADGKFVPAVATIEPAAASGLKEDTIVVESAAVSKPAAVRFGWSGIAQPNLMNKEGLPASPFRTDDWPGILEQGKK